jgi:hypothetical protein
VREDARVLGNERETVLTDRATHGLVFFMDLRCFCVQLASELRWVVGGRERVRVREHSLQRPEEIDGCWACAAQQLRCFVDALEKFGFGQLRVGGRIQRDAHGRNNANGGGAAHGKPPNGISDVVDISKQQAHLPLRQLRLIEDVDRPPVFRPANRFRIVSRHISQAAHAPATALANVRSSLY